MIPPTAAWGSELADVGLVSVQTYGEGVVNCGANCVQFEWLVTFLSDTELWSARVWTTGRGDGVLESDVQGSFANGYLLRPSEGGRYEWYSGVHTKTFESLADCQTWTGDKPVTVGASFSVHQTHGWFSFAYPSPAPISPEVCLAS